MKDYNHYRMARSIISLVLALVLSPKSILRISGLRPSSLVSCHRRHHALHSRECNVRPPYSVDRQDSPISTFSLSSQKISSEWDEATTSQLKSQLKQLNLPISGVKAELIQRLQNHHRENNLPLKSKKKSISTLPPPKDEIEIQVIEKEVQETVRMLDGLKFGNSNTSFSKSGIESSATATSATSSSTSRQLSRQQKQERELMQSLKQSLKQSQQHKSSSSSTTTRLSSPAATHGSSVAFSSSEQVVNSQKNQYYIEQLRLRAANDLKVELSSLGFSLSVPKPTPIQGSAIPYLFYPPHPSALLHAPTGSGKTIAYLLPITETLWKEVEGGEGGSRNNVNDMSNGMAIILLPTRELAAQVAGVASVLAPPGMVRLIPRPMDLMRCWKDEVDIGEEYEYLQSIGKDGRVSPDASATGRTYKPRILIGSAKAIGTSLFGDAKMPGTPTSKPEGKQLLSSVRWLVMDECDRLLNIEKSRSEKKSRRHEKPAALLAAAIARLTLGRVQVIAASATIGRPLRRELSRVLGLHSSECPETIRGEEDTATWEQKMTNDDEKHIGRAVKIPETVKNYVLPVDGTTTGSLLTAAAFASKAILRPVHASTSSNRKVLVVLTRNCGIKVHNALGALRHFGIQPEPQSLLDALEADGTDRLVEAHRRVSQVEGVGGGATTQRSNNFNDSGNEGGEGYLLIAHEDNVRGLHLAGLDAVVVVGRPGSPDEYTHIAGRTGRAGRRGSVLNIVSFEQAAALASWTKMLGVDFLPVDESEVASIVDE
ncbi:hypothetical protein ACHAWU_002692 [Discostella pseudostelligera]|uniref:ATP-dependent RNA helicase n=1 Tax=Discostella pseudostelligera TaxID=259834 RepID=A0ABD3MXS3_9STRA